MMHFINAMDKKLVKKMNKYKTNKGGLWPFPKQKLVFLRDIVEGYCNGEKYVPPLLPEDDCTRLEFLLNKIAYGWLVLDQWGQLFRECAEIVHKTMRPEDAADTVRHLKKAYLNGGFENMKQFEKWKNFMVAHCALLDRIEPKDECETMLFDLLSIDKWGSEGLGTHIVQDVETKIRQYMGHLPRAQSHEAQR